MHMDIMMQNVEKMRNEDPVRFAKLVNEGMAIELGIISPISKKEKSAEKLIAEYFPSDPKYREVSQGVLDGKRKVVEPAIKALIDAGKDPVDLVTNALMPGIQVQCEMYDLGLSFVPEILMSNDAMQAGIKLCQDKIGDVPHGADGLWGWWGGRGWGLSFHHRKLASSGTEVNIECSKKRENRVAYGSWLALSQSVERSSVSL